MKKSLFAILALICGTALLTSAQQNPQAETTAAESFPAQIDLMKMSRDARCGQVLVTCIVNGKPMRMMLDTGATHTVLHNESAATLKNVQWVDTSRMKFNSNSKQNPKILVAPITLGPGVTSPKHPIIVVSLAAVRSMMAEKIDGIIGMDILGSMPFTFDLPNKEYYWGAPEGKRFFPISGGTDSNGRLFMQVKSGEKTFSLLLDTGSSITRISAEDWAPGSAGEISAQIGDVDTASSQKMIQGKPGRLETPPDLLLSNITPLLCDDEGGDDRTMLGMDALADSVLVHLPTEESFFGKFFFAK